MNGDLVSNEYIALLKNGPFPGRIDPWFEAGIYFHPVHNSIIENLQIQMQDRLIRMGYLIGKETSLQIAEGSQPDIHIERHTKSLENSRWEYVLAAEEILADAGTLVEEYPELWSLHIHELSTSKLVSIIELISPSNKSEPSIIQLRSRRSRLVYEKGINFVEIDLTRSVKHLLESKSLVHYAYHSAIYLPHELPRLIGVKYGNPLKRLAIPLRQQVIGIEIQDAYNHAYRLNSTAIHLLDDDYYQEDNLPFPSLLSKEQRTAAMQAVSEWKTQLAQLR